MNILEEIRNDIIALSDAETKEKVVRLTSGAKCYGVTVPKLRALAKTYKKRNLDFAEILTIANDFFANENREEILFAVFLLALYKKEKVHIAWETILQWTCHLDNWETCDQLSSGIAVDMLLSRKDFVQDLTPLAQSDNLWQRRFAVATMANLNHGGRQFKQETLAIVNLLRNEKEPMVKKAIVWALKEIEK
ncbi:MAG: DNA alkylation repair protein [Bacteroidales bacterium]|jgi:3-methyladenine DNA glycosylase AlkD|nr:DNA alkylation repair protein [Bacteroidales bacterium]